MKPRFAARDRSVVPPLGSVMLQRSVAHGVRAHAAEARRRGEHPDLVRTDLANAGIPPASDAGSDATSTLAMGDAEERMAIRRERGRRRFAAWLSYPLWILGLAPALLAVTSMRTVGLDPENTPPPEMPLLPTSTTLFAALLAVRVVGAMVIRRPPNRPFFRRVVMLLPIAGPLSVGFASLRSPSSQRRWRSVRPD
jgi:hypothetical protein